jgi:hypothetical protein
VVGSSSYWFEKLDIDGHQLSGCIHIIEAAADPNPIYDHRCPVDMDTRDLSKSRKRCKFLYALKIVQVYSQLNQNSTPVGI